MSEPRKPPDLEDLVAAGLPLWAAIQLHNRMLSVAGSPHDPLLFEKMVADRVASLRGAQQLH